MQKLVEIASGVGDGSLSASAVVEQHLARIDARESEIHAFNLVTADQARLDAAKVDADVKAGKKLERSLACRLLLRTTCARVVLKQPARQKFCKVGSRRMTPQL